MSRTDTTTTAPSEHAASFDVDRVRRDFPILQTTVNGHPLVYLDNAATAQKPQAVLDALHDYYTQANANVHRGVHHLSVEATRRYDAARATMQRFLNAARPEEIIFVRGSTEACNLVSTIFARDRIGEGDEIILTTMEHHSNIVPWQIVCEHTGAKLRIAPITDAGELMLEEYEKLFTPRTKIVAAVHTSNALGTVNPVKAMIDIAHRHDVPVLLDGAQAAPHEAIDVQDLDCDFFTVAGHKMFGPTGIGVLYGRYDLLDTLPPYHGGGDMILSVSFDKTTYNRLPNKYEAGTPNIAGAIGLAAAAEYLMNIGMDNVAAYEQTLLAYATGKLSAIPDLRLVGTAARKTAVVSFLLGDIHPHDIGTVLDQRGIAIRAGHHCTQPLMERFGITATARASFSFYNTMEEVDALADGLRHVAEVFA